jgi:predicted enzyme related to lactoylglutathione lyase
MLTNAPVSPQIPVVNFNRAVSFYQDTLGLTPILIESEAGVAMFQCGGGTQLMLYQRGPSNAEHTLAAFGVEDVEQTVDDLTQRGVVFEQYDFPGLKTDARGIAQLGPGQVAWFKDTEGNILAVGTPPV